MPVKAITHPETGRTYKLGRKPPPHVDPRPKLHLANYLFDAAPVPPASVHYSRKAERALSMPLCNDSLNCCEVSGPAHMIGVFAGNAGSSIPVFTDAQVVSLYSAIGGYLPGKPETDQGCDTQTMLAYWRDTGFSGHKIAGWVAIDPNRPNQVKTAIHLFENCLFGVGLPDDWVNGDLPKASGFRWDVAGPAVADQGHFFLAIGYNDNGVDISTWGMVGQMSWPAVAKYAAASAGGELYAAISQEVLNRATLTSPAGADWQGLVADFESLGGRL